MGGHKVDSCVATARHKGGPESCVELPGSPTARCARSGGPLDYSAHLHMEGPRPKSGPGPSMCGAAGIPYCSLRSQRGPTRLLCTFTHGRTPTKERPGSFHVWSCRESNPGPLMLNQDFSGCSLLIAFLSPGIRADTPPTGSVALMSQPGPTTWPDKQVSSMRPVTGAETPPGRPFA